MHLKGRVSSCHRSSETVQFHQQKRFSACPIAPPFLKHVASLCALCRLLSLSKFDSLTRSQIDQPRHQTSDTTQYSNKTVLVFQHSFTSAIGLPMSSAYLSKAYIAYPSVNYLFLIFFRFRKDRKGRFSSTLHGFISPARTSCPESRSLN